MPPRKKTNGSKQPVKQVADSKQRILKLPAAQPAPDKLANNQPTANATGELVKGAHGPRRTLKNRKAVGPGQLYRIMIQLLPDDRKKLAAIDQEFLCESDSKAARIALMRWHRHLTRLSQRPGWAPPSRPEFSITASPASGGKQTKIYCTKQDMARFDELAILTERKGFGQLTRAAIGWLYENLD